MSDTESATKEIVVSEDFPNRPETLWKALTTGTLIERWMGMAPVGFEARPGNRFTFQTSPAGAWDGTISCEVIEAVPNEKLVYSWKGGDAENEGYGSPLETIVTFKLTRTTDETRLELVHSGFRLPLNETAYENMGKGWNQCASNLHDVANDL